MREASIDPLFLADIEEIHKDFDSIDNETVWAWKNGLFTERILTRK
jgi:hypothetical protein